MKRSEHIDHIFPRMFRKNSWKKRSLRHLCACSIHTKYTKGEQRGWEEWRVCSPFYIDSIIELKRESFQNLNATLQQLNGWAFQSGRVSPLIYPFLPPPLPPLSHTYIQMHTDRSLSPPFIHLFLTKKDELIVFFHGCCWSLIHMVWINLS